VSLALAAGRSQAVVANLADGNSIVQFDTNNPTTRTGMTNWVVDGTSQLWNQWFWYRIGSNGPENRFNNTNLAELASGVSDTNFDGQNDTFFIRYGGAGFTSEMRFTLQGGTAGSNRSDVSEQIRITNTGNTPLDYHFFQYCDFDLAGTIPDTSVSITGNNTAHQTDDGMETTETVVTPQPTHHEVGIYPVTINSLDDGGPTTLNDSSSLSGPADYTWAFEWDFTINPGDSYIISKDKNIGPVPSPAALSLLGLGGLAAMRRRR
jgi:MYXO-CTERM domain-containing protein